MLLGSFQLLLASCHVCRGLRQFSSQGVHLSLCSPESRLQSLILTLHAHTQRCMHEHTDRRMNTHEHMNTDKRMNTHTQDA